MILHNISKKYGVTLDELTKLNPQIKEGKLAIGDVLIITKKNSEVVKLLKKSGGYYQSKLGKIVLQPKQTIYGITKQYHISEADLRKLNPNRPAYENW